MSDRIKTGSPGLDSILCGGFLRHNSILLKGAPGTGKTSLGVQILLQGVRDEGEGAVICSFEQFPQQLMRDTRAFGWDLQKFIDEDRLRILYIEPSDLIVPAGGASPQILSRLFEEAEAVGARRLLVDSVSHFNRIDVDPVERRALLLHFLNETKADGMTPILTSEISAGRDGEFSFEEYLVDEALLLHNDPVTSTASLPQRSVEVVKTRGHAHVQGRHPLAFRPDGIEVFPHILPEPFGEKEMADRTIQPVSSGVKGVDQLLCGGYSEGAAAILAGMSGTFKTTLAAAFLAEGARADEEGWLLTFEETPQYLVKTQGRRGVDLAAGVDSGKIRIAHYVPKKCSLDEIFADLKARLDTGRLKRVVIDGLGGFERSIDNPDAYKDYLAMFLAALGRAGTTTLLTQKLSRVSQANPIADIRYVSMVDTVVYLGAVEIESRIHKVISILKSRGSCAEPDLRELVCGPSGLHVATKFHGLSGILQGTARGQYKQTVENIFQPLYFVRDFAAIGAGDQADDAQRRKILGDILAQVETLDGALKDFFGFDPEETKKQ
ncbi:hypothetical protein JW916_03705 [Candidatus Sumerlaeota bacterium]|nr:hypothetical protein [Candidatus Sumerlaeota bacterium]